MRLNILVWMMFFASLSGCGGFATRPVETAGSSAPAIHRAPVNGARTEALLQTLLALDVDYRYGGKSAEQGLDCSGLVAHVYHQAYGLQLPPNTRAQSELGTPVAFADLEPGDLVFYNTLNRPYSHVGIYLGDGRFVHAPKAGARVRVENLRTAYWVSRFNGARRITPAI